MDWHQYDAALFDLDGVITPTAGVHMKAWSAMFNDFLSGIADQDAYTDEDYFAHVDGKPRYDGVRDFLAHRGIELPEGEVSDSPDERTVCGLGNRKDVAFNEIIERDGVEPYPGTVGLLDDLSALGVRVAVVSSSKNAGAVLEAAGVKDRFELIVDGNVAKEQDLDGKPAPDTYAFAAESLGVSVTRCVVIEDAVSGVASGRAGDFGLVLGVDRGAGHDALSEAGADLVLSDLAEVRP